MTSRYLGQIKATDELREAIQVGPYPGVGSGDLDLSEVFAWRFTQLINDQGTLGVVLPRSVLISDGTKEWRQRVLARSSAELTQLINSGRWVFPDVHPQYSICLLVLSAAAGGPEQIMTMAGPFHDLDEFRSGVQMEALSVTAADILEWNEDAAIPRLPDAGSLRVFVRLRAHPALTSPDQPWSVRIYNEFHSTADKVERGGPVHVEAKVADGAWPVYKGETFGMWEPGAGLVYGWAMPDEALSYLVAKRKTQVRNRRSPFFGLPASWASDPSAQPANRSRVAWRKVGRANDTRSFHAVLLPPSAFTADHNYCLFFDGSRPESLEAFVLGIMCSVPFDWYARLWVEANFTKAVVQPFPLPGARADTTVGKRLIEQAARLAAVDDRYSDWAEAVGVGAGHLRDPIERADAIAELDALSALLYGLEWPDVQHIFKTFHRGWDYSDRIEAVERHYRAWGGNA